MFEEINQKMAEAQQGILKLKKLNSKLEELYNQKYELDGKVSECKQLLDKENLDVENMEGKNMAHLLYSILGKLEEKTEKERQEAIAARLKYDQAAADLERIMLEISNLEEERTQYVMCESTYQKLYELKSEQIISSESNTAERIFELNKNKNTVDHNKAEISEAIAAGERVLSHLNNAINSLDSAEGYGTWDLFGGGLLADLGKHSKIDEAKAEAEHIQTALYQFKTELADVQIQNNIHFEMDGFAKFADFFFDGLFADWSMQSRIHETQESVLQVKNQVERVLNRLKSMEREETSRLEGIKKEINQLIIND